jgi:putative inorganic carbon (hco3(-)) transporter
MTEHQEAKVEYFSGLLWPMAVAALTVTGVAVAFSDSMLLIVGFCLCLTAIAALRLEVFLYAQIFLLPWYPLLEEKLPVRDLTLALRFISLAGVAVYRMSRGKAFSAWVAGRRAKKAILVFTFIAAISLWASFQGPNVDAMRSLARWLSYLALFYAMCGWLERREQMQTALKLILASGMLVALFGFYQVLAQGYSDLYYSLYPLQQEGLEPWNGRITSFLFHFNSLAGYLNLILPLSLACMVLGEGTSLRRTALACHGMALAALYFTGSRGGLIAYCILPPAAIYFLPSRRVAIGKVLTAIALAAAIVALLRIPAEFAAESESRLRQVDEFTSASRLALWSAAGAMFVQHPFMGVGYGNYRSLYNNYLPAVPPNQLDAHNLYLQVLSETGVIGFLAFSLLIFELMRVAIRLARNSESLNRSVGIAMGGALATTLTHGMVDYLFNVSPQFGGMFWLIMALGVAASVSIPEYRAGLNRIQSRLK